MPLINAINYFGLPSTCVLPTIIGQNSCESIIVTWCILTLPKHVNAIQKHTKQQQNQQSDYDWKSLRLEASWNLSRAEKLLCLEIIKIRAAETNQLEKRLTPPPEPLGTVSYLTHPPLPPPPTSWLVLTPHPPNPPYPPILAYTYPSPTYPPGEGKCTPRGG